MIWSYGYEGWALLFARLILGIVMVHYGIPKMRDLRGNAKWFDKIGFRPGFLWGNIAAFLEFFGGIAIIAGFCAPLFAALYAAQMAMGTIWKIKDGRPFSDYSYDLLVLAVALLIVVFGQGIFALYGASFLN